MSLTNINFCKANKNKLSWLCWQRGIVHNDQYKLRETERKLGRNTDALRKHVYKFYPDNGVKSPEKLVVVKAVFEKMYGKGPGLFSGFHIGDNTANGLRADMIAAAHYGSGLSSLRTKNKFVWQAQANLTRAYLDNTMSSEGDYSDKVYTAQCCASGCAFLISNDKVLMLKVDVDGDNYTPLRTGQCVKCPTCQNKVLPGRMSKRVIANIN
jgi:hypothetical protein